MDEVGFRRQGRTVCRDAFRAAVQVPLDASAARVLILRKIFRYAVAPTVIALFVAADVLLEIAGRPAGDLPPQR